MLAQSNTRAQQLTSSISASAAATGYVQTNYPANALLFLNVLDAGGGTVTLALSSGTATGAAGSAVTSVTASTTGMHAYRLPRTRLSKYAYASGSGSAGAPTWVANLVVSDFSNYESASGVAGEPTQL